MAHKNLLLAHLTTLFRTSTYLPWNDHSQNRRPSLPYNPTSPSTHQELEDLDTLARLVYGSGQPSNPITIPTSACEVSGISNRGGDTGCVVCVAGWILSWSVFTYWMLASETQIFAPSVVLRVLSGKNRYYLGISEQIKFQTQPTIHIALLPYRAHLSRPSKVITHVGRQGCPLRAF